MSSVSNSNTKICADFIEWVNTMLIRNDSCNEINTFSFDLQDFVALMQCLGFRVTNFRAYNADGEAPLTCGYKGLKIVTTCTNSGQKVVLEKKGECACIKLPKCDDEFWEVNVLQHGKTQTQTSPFVESSRSSSFWHIPKDFSDMISSVIKYFTVRFREYYDNANNGKLIKNLDTSLQSLPDALPLATSSTVDLQMDEACGLDLPKIPENSSPARYRSLDTLTSKKVVGEIPEPGALKKKDSTPKNIRKTSVTSSSPNIKISSDEAEKTETIEKMLKSSIQMIQKVLEMMEIGKSDTTFPVNSKIKPPSQKKLQTIEKFFETTLNNRPTALPKIRKYSGSSPVLTHNNQNKREATVPGQNLNLFRSNSTRCASSSKKQTLVIKETTAASTSKVSDVLVSTRPNKKMISLYGHIKSTIPKPTPVKKDLNKKQ